MLPVFGWNETLKEVTDLHVDSLMFWSKGHEGLVFLLLWWSVCHKTASDFEKQHCCGMPTLPHKSRTTDTPKSNFTHQPLRADGSFYEIPVRARKVLCGYKELSGCPNRKQYRQPLLKGLRVLSTTQYKFDLREERSEIMRGLPRSTWQFRGRGRERKALPSQITAPSLALSLSTKCLLSRSFTLLRECRENTFTTIKAALAGSDCPHLLSMASTRCGQRGWEQTTAQKQQKHQEQGPRHTLFERPMLRGRKL